jgi:hypothetical protein
MGFQRSDVLSTDYPTFRIPYGTGRLPGLSVYFWRAMIFSGKTIVPFCTSHSSGIGSSAAKLHALCPDTLEWAEGRRFEAGTSRDAMEEWLSSIGVR